MTVQSFVAVQPIVDVILVWTKPAVTLTGHRAELLMWLQETLSRNAELTRPKLLWVSLRPVERPHPQERGIPDVFSAVSFQVQS